MIGYSLHKIHFWNSSSQGPKPGGKVKNLEPFASGTFDCLFVTDSTHNGDGKKVKLDNYRNCQMRSAPRTVIWKVVRKVLARHWSSNETIEEYESTSEHGRHWKSAACEIEVLEVSAQNRERRKSDSDRERSNRYHAIKPLFSNSTLKPAALVKFSFLTYEKSL